MLKPMDIVRTPRGAIAMVTNVSQRGEVSIGYLGVRHFGNGGGANPTGERNALWGKENGLILIYSIPRIISFAMGDSFKELDNANKFETNFSNRQDEISASFFFTICEI